MASQSNMTPECELSLVLAALLGDLEAFDALVRRFRGAIIIVAEEMSGCREQAEDVAQEVFLLAFKALPQLHDPARFSSWLYAIARHRARRVAMRAGRQRPVEASVLDRLILTNSFESVVHPEQEVVRRAERAYLPEALEQLPPDFRVPLRLRYYEEWTVQQIGEFLMLPVTTVKWRLHKGRLLMRALLTARQRELGENEDGPK
ncbi:MAG TPA: sigma-70 family RNA polymerase sigma factor [Chthonomonadaceae bacterium]|nr:sigma-70 family RNA polymerase sigma factor [Chthonomonadaceae bacterium]